MDGDNVDKEKDIAGALVLAGQCPPRELSFEEILLDETLLEGDIWVRKEALANVGGINYRLGAKRGYELLVRIAKEYRVLRIGQEAGIEMLKAMGKECQTEDGRTKGDNMPCVDTELWIHMDAAVNGEAIEAALKTDCYLIGRYKAELLAMGCFDDAVMGILSAGSKPVTHYLEKMVAGSKEFYEIYDCTQPILIYIGSDLCYNILDTFAGCLGDALEERGQKVEYFDFSRQPVTELGSYVERRFKAVIGIQTYMFSVKRDKGGLVHDEIAAPKYHFVFDHPVWVKEHLKQVPRGLCVLTPDRNYAKFVEYVYGHPARFLPPGGSLYSGGLFPLGNEAFGSQEHRDYGIAFLGSYGEGLAEHLRDIWDEDRKRRHLLNRYILYMRGDLTETPEHAFKRALEYYGITYTLDEFLEMFYRERWLIFWLANYYRNKVVKTLLDAGITLHVFGESWKKSPLWGHSGLICHEAAIGQEALAVYARSKLSLNVMMWHKDGFTERIANGMLQRSVVVTDKTAYLEENFVNGQDILMFDLGHLEELPGQVKSLLEDEEKRRQIAGNGYRKAVQQHTWRHRAGALLEMIEKDRE